MYLVSLEVFILGFMKMVHVWSSSEWHENELDR